MDRKQTIIIADGNEKKRAVLSEILSDQYLIIESANGQQTLDILVKEHETTAAVVLDLAMTALDGKSFLSFMRQDPRFIATPVIVTTQSKNTKTEIFALKMGATDFIQKPYEPSIIRQRLANILALREAAAQRNTAERDALTGVFNKDTFYRKAGELLLRAGDDAYDIICIDIEQFKIINDLYGAPEGDKLLCFVAQILQQYSDIPNSFLGRVGADIFAICTPRQSLYADTLVAGAFSQLKNYPLNFSIVLRFGVYQVDDIGIPVSTMCDRANLAIRSIKGKYNRYIALYDDSHRRQLLEEQEITGEMHAALLDGQFEVFYQPKYNLTTGEIVGAEALTRWIHPQKGIIPPDKFVPLFERSGFITSLDIHIWQKVCKQIRKRIDSGCQPIPISINISRVDIYNPFLCGILENMVKRFQLEPNLLELEITETAYTQNADQLIKVIGQLKELGFLVAMDDFGSGYSSLNMLNEVPVDVIKLDMRFLNKSQGTVRDGNILNFIVDLAKWMGLPLVAEGIETAQQVAYLRGMGCNCGQGFFFSKPLSGPEFEKLLDTNQIARPCNEILLTYNHLNLKEIWDPSSTFNLLFNGYVGALAIYEFKNDKLSLIRGNDRFYQVWGDNCDKVFYYSSNLLNLIHDDDKDLFMALLSRLKNEKLELGCDNRWKKPHSDEYRWYHQRYKLLLDIEDRCLILGAIEDITVQRQMEDALRYQHDYYKNLFDTLPCGIAQLSTEEDLVFLSGNAAVAKLFGYTNETFWKEKRRLMDFVRPKHKVYLKLQIPRLEKLKQGKTLTLEYEITSDDGQIKWIQSTTQRIDRGESIIYQCMMNDITEQKIQEDHIRFTKEQYLDVAQNAKTQIYRYDVATKTATMISGEMEDENCQVTQNIPDSFIENGCVAPESVTDYYDIFQSIRNGQRQGEAEICFLRPKGDFGWFRAQFFTQFSKTGKPTQAICIFSDITAMKQQAAMLYDISRREPLTGLYNRIAFEELVSAKLGKSTGQETHAFLVLDIDSFKQVNDTHGHMLGDDVIVSLSQVLQSLLRKNDVLARIGGDEFAVFMQGISGPEAGTRKGDQICQAFAAANSKNGLTCSIGVAIVPEHGKCFSSLYHKADMALYRAKHEGKNRCCLFHSELMKQ